MAIREAAQRKQDTLDKLEHERDVWVATADEHGHAHLVPFSLAWDGARVIVATEAESRSTRNVTQSHQARLALGTTRDVVIIEVQVVVVEVGKADNAIGELFATRNGWDPRTASTEMVYFLMNPVSIQAWQSEEELEGRTLMRGGQWLSRS